MSGVGKEASLAGAGGNLSLVGLFLQADWVVKTVLLLLTAASMWVWAVVFKKSVSLRRANRVATISKDRFWSGRSLDELFRQEGERPTHLMAAVFGAETSEWQRTDHRRGQKPPEHGHSDGKGRCHSCVTRDGSSGTLDGVLGIRRLHRSVCGAIRHSMRHHALIFSYSRQ